MNDPTMSVLLVEDDEVVRTSMCFALESARLRVVEAGSVAEGLRRFHEGGADLVVIDLHLPDGTGYELAERLWRQRPELPLVLISTDPGDAPPPPPLPSAHGRTALLAKPFSASELLDAISLVTVGPPAG